MNLGKKMLWGGLGWALGGPIGAIIGYSLGKKSSKMFKNISTFFRRQKNAQGRFRLP